MTDLESARNWARYFETVCSPKTKFDALTAAFDNGGDQMLALVLKELGAESGVELVKRCMGK